MGDTINWGIFKRHFWGELLRHQQRTSVVFAGCVRHRTQPFSFSERLYKLCWRIERATNRLKDFKRVAPRYDRLACNNCLVASLVWWI